MSPNLTSKLGHGISLITFGSNVTEDNQDFLLQIVDSFGMTEVGSEEDMNLLGKVTGCGPGFVAAILAEYIAASQKLVPTVDPKTIEAMVMETLLGDIKLMEQRNMTLPEIVRGVATKGGITEAGANSLKEDLPAVYEKCFRTAIDRSNNLTAEMTKKYLG